MKKVQVHFNAVKREIDAALKQGYEVNLFTEEDMAWGLIQFSSGDAQLNALERITQKASIQITRQQVCSVAKWYALELPIECEGDDGEFYGWHERIIGRQHISESGE